MEVFSIILYVLGAILLAVLIVLGLKLIDTVTKLNVTLDDVNRKIKTLDGVFETIDYITNKLSTVSTTLVGVVNKSIKKVFNKKESEDSEDE